MGELIPEPGHRIRIEHVQRDEIDPSAGELLD